MYKILIADDEEWIRRRLIDTVNWRDAGITEVYEAEDGASALSLALEHCPDVVLTDIRMPDLSGLEFMERLAAASCPPKVIFLSGYDSFNYAQKAISLGAHAYLLKPASNEELLESVKACIAVIGAERLRSAALADLTQKAERDKPLLKEYFLQGLLNGYAEAPISDSDTDCLSLPDGGAYRLCCAVAACERGTLSEPDMRVITSGLKDLAKKYYSDCAICEPVFIRYGEIACILFINAMEKDPMAAVDNASRRLLKSAWHILNAEVTVGIGELADSLSDLPESYNQALQAVMYRSFFGAGKIYRYDGLKDMARQNIQFNFDADQWLETLKRRGVDGVADKIAALCEKAVSSGAAPVDLKLLFTEIVMRLINKLYGFENVAQTHPAFNLEFFETLNKINTPADLNKNLISILSVITQSMEEGAQGSNKRVIRAAVEYIESNYAQPILLAEAAKRVFLNPNYFCRLFKLETGQTFSKYIMNYRIKKACELMADPEKKIYEIAGMVGYADVQYFNRIFKSVKGLSPSQYRDKYFN